MRKQILAVMVGLSVALAGCSTQSTDSMLQEVKKDAKEVKSGKATMMLSMKNEKNSSAGSSGYEVSGDEKFDPLELKMNGKFFQGDKSRDIEDYIKDGVYYIKGNIGSKTVWYKEKVPTDNKHALNFKDQSISMQEGILNLLDNKDNWDVTKDGDKVTFKLKKTDELKNKVIEERVKKISKQVKFSEFDYTIEYVFNTKTKDIEKIVSELNFKTEGSTTKGTIKGSLEEINKEVKIEVPEESKSAVELKK
jgi:lipoprotein